ncbi:MAG: DUF1823 family protein [Cyanobacteria bacterium P01_D01_bin.73]
MTADSTCSPTSDQPPVPVPSDQVPTLSTEVIWGILNDDISDAIAHQLVWNALGYRWNPQTQTWDASPTPDDWSEAYPIPPRFIDSRPATVKLTRSIPKANKKLLAEELGFKGYKINELTPRKTRRATIANWLLNYLRSQGKF